MKQDTHKNDLRNQDYEDQRMIAFSLLSSLVGIGAAWTFWVARIFF